MQNYYNETTLHPIGLLAVLALGFATLLLPRRLALIPILIMACFVPIAQRVVVATLDFNLLRIMVLFGWARLVLCREYAGFTLRGIDIALIAWAIAGAVAMSLVEGTLETVINRAGMVFDALGMYLLFRVLIRSWAEAESLTRAIAVLSVPVACVFLVEYLTGRNMFSIFGGVPEITTMRQGRLRCRGPFVHPILAGCCWAALMPLIATVWRQARGRWLAPIGLIAASLVVFTTSSSTPASVYLLGWVAVIILYPLRHHMRFVRLSTVVMLVILHLIMVQPVWHLMARADLFSGSTGWYRYKLFDEFLRHFGDWWLIGEPASQVALWWEYRFDAITNQFVAEGVKGGLLTLALFIAAITLACFSAGRVTHAEERNRGRTRMGFGIGIAILIHCLSFFGVAYDEQTVLFWYMTLALAGSLGAAVEHGHAAPSRAYALFRLPRTEASPQVSPA